MDVFTIHGGRPLRGCVGAAGSKNAALPIMAACLLADAPVVLARVPDLADVNTLALVLGHLGVEVKRRPCGLVDLATVDPRAVVAEASLVGQMRASFCVLGPLLARRRRAVVALPGGCRIGPRPVDLHLRGLEALGAELRVENGYVVARCRALRGATIDLTGPRGPSVTATANVLSAAVLARGKTTIRGAAREPEIVDLGRFLTALGARIEGLGTSLLHVAGVDSLGGGRYQIIPDRIEAGTLLVGAAITGGDVAVGGCDIDHMDTILALLEDAGQVVQTEGNRVRLAARRVRPFRATALPYPGLPTDLQAQFTALAALAEGECTIGDAVFPARFGHVAELCRMGADIRRSGNAVRVRGAAELRGTSIVATDLRASAALVLAGLAAGGRTVVHGVHHLYRGYERLHAKLQSLGADIEVVSPPFERRVAAGAPAGNLVAL